MRKLRVETETALFLDPFGADKGFDPILVASVVAGSTELYRLTNNSMIA